jgi:uncharacterized protein involved in exopolysaccharide biosynthesis
MLQKLDLDDGQDGDSLAYGAPPVERDQSHLLSASFYWQILKRRAVVFFLSFVVVLAGGMAAAVLWPPTYYAVGRILVESQQIPTDLVRPTVTSAAQERIQVIEQRTMTRENLLAIVDKFRLFPEKRSLLSTSQLVELMKKQIKIEPPSEPLVFAKLRTRNDNPTVIFNVGFEYSDPETAARVANELVTRILNEDLRDRTSRASDTTKFLYREVQKLQSDIATIDARIAQAKVSQLVPDASGNAVDPQTARLAQLKAELVQRGTLYSDKHPLIQSLKRQIEALEKSIAQPALSKPNASKPGAKPADVNELDIQRDALQKNLEAASAKLDAARLGEALEKNQQSEKLEVIEQPTAPQEPIRPNRPKIMALAVLLAFGAAGGLTFLLEITDRAIRRAADLHGVVDNRLVVVVPYITTTAELRRRRVRLILAAVIGSIVLASAVFVAIEVLPPLDLIIARIRAGILR